MAALKVGDRRGAALDAVEEVADVTRELLAVAAGVVAAGLGPVFLAATLRDALHAADRRVAGEARHTILRRHAPIGREHVAAATQAQRAARAAELEAPGLSGPGTPLAVGPDRGESRAAGALELEEGVLRVGRLAVVLEAKSSADAGDRLRHALEKPVNDVEAVMAEVGHLAAGVVPEPAE